MSDFNVTGINSNKSLDTQKTTSKTEDDEILIFSPMSNDNDNNVKEKINAGPTLYAGNNLRRNITTQRTIATYHCVSLSSRIGNLFNNDPIRDYVEFKVEAGTPFSYFEGLVEDDFFYGFDKCYTLKDKKLKDTRLTNWEPLHFKENITEEEFSVIPNGINYYEKAFASGMTIKIPVHSLAKKTGLSISEIKELFYAEQIQKD